MELTHVRILVDNYKESFIFYRDALGFEVSWGDETTLYGQFIVGSTQLGIFERKQMVESIGSMDASMSTNTDTAALILKVDSVEEKYMELKEKVNFITTPKEQPDWGLLVAHFRDPEGTLIEIYENLEM